MTHPLLERKHLEALLIARTVLDPAFADDVFVDRLSPAALALLDEVGEWPAIASAALEGLARDEYQLRLARRVVGLTLEELAWYSPDTLVALVNQLPAIGARRVA